MFWVTSTWAPPNQKSPLYYLKSEYTLHTKQSHPHSYKYCVPKPDSQNPQSNRVLDQYTEKHHKWTKEENQNTLDGRALYKNPAKITKFIILK